VGRCRWETVSYSQRPKGKVCWRSQLERRAS